MTTDYIFRGALLRIKSTGEVIRVEQVTRRKFGYFRGGDKQSHMQYVRASMCEPIPVTEEWLLNHGFAHDTDEEKYRKKSGSIYEDFLSLVSADGQVRIDTFSNTPSPYDWFVHVDNDRFESVASADIAYVHEIQYLLQPGCRFQGHEVVSHLPEKS